MARMWRIVVAVLVCVSWMSVSPVFGTVDAQRPAETAKQPSSVYVEKGNWPDSLSATRDRYQAGNSVMAVSGWYIHGEKYDSRTIDTSFAPETSHVSLDTKGKGKMAGWKEVRRTQEGKLARYLARGTVAYAYREFFCTRDDVRVEAEFAVTAGHLAVWLNGKKIFAEESANVRNSMQKTAMLCFTKGKNRLLVKMAASRGANMSFSLAGTSMERLKTELMRHGENEAFLLCKTGYFRNLEQWFFTPNSGGLLKIATSSLMSSIRGFSTLQREFASLSRTDPDKNASNWIKLYTTLAALRSQLDSARSQWEITTNTKALRRALLDLEKTFPDRYSAAKYIKQLDVFESELPAILAGVMRREKVALARYNAYAAFRRAALLANPLIDFEELLFVKRAEGVYSGLPNNYIGNTGITYELDDAIVTSNVHDPSPTMTAVYKPSRAVFCGDIDLHFNADRILFSSTDANGQWQVYERNLKNAHHRQVTHGPRDVDCYDPLYLPDGRIMFNSTSGYHGVPCIGGHDAVANLHIMDRDGNNVRRLTYDQDHNWYPSLMPDGRVMYLRWEYTDTPHYFSRVLMRMNPDGTGQRALYGSNSYWPNGLWYARSIPGAASKFVAIVSGHHGSTRFGELAVFDVRNGSFEADGAVQRLPGYGKLVEPVMVDGLANGSWPKFIHPYPLSEKYFLVSARIGRGSRLVGIYLVDVFDNIVPIKELPGFMLLEPLPMRKATRPPIIPDRVQANATESTVFIHDVSVGTGLRNVPRGVVSSLRIFQYEYGYRDYAGAGVIGCDGPWDVRRIIGTVPVYKDGSASFVVPANSPISLQPLDNEGKALALFRSWFVGMPGETVSCIGCHEDQNDASPPARTIASASRPVQPKPWYGPKRGFSFIREVQPVLDKHCVGCHSGSTAQRKKIPDLSFDPKDKKAYVRFGKGNRFSKSYHNLHPYVRRNGVEGDYHPLTPLEFHADRSELIQILRKNHHGVTLDKEAWDRLITWIDLNVPFYGTWCEAAGGRLPPSDMRVKRRYELKKLYAMKDDDSETVAQAYVRVPFVEPVQPKRPTSDLRVEGWPFDAKAARSKQGADATRAIALADRVNMNFVRIPSGRFIMGSTRGELDELPVSDVTISKPFWMATTEVLNKQYALFDKNHDSGFLDAWGNNQPTRGYDVRKPDMPVIRVSWERANEFCKWMSKKTGKKVALPTEVQWEWACRAGSATAMSYGDMAADFSGCENLADVTTKQLVRGGIKNLAIPNPTPGEAYLPAVFTSNDGALVTTKAGSYRPNAWGLYDMHGNVQEWTRSTYRPYPNSETNAPKATGGTERKVVRGGSWRDRPKRATASYRRDYPAWQVVYNVGFRVIIEE